MQRAAAGTAASYDVRSVIRDGRASQIAGQAVTTSPISAATPAMPVVTCSADDVTRCIPNVNITQVVRLKAWDLTRSTHAARCC